MFYIATIMICASTFFRETRKELEDTKGGNMNEVFFSKLKIEKKAQNASDSKHFSQATKMWRLYSVALGSIVIPPYLGYCKLFQVFN